MNGLKGMPRSSFLLGEPAATVAAAGKQLSALDEDRRDGWTTGHDQRPGGGCDDQSSGWTTQRATTELIELRPQRISPWSRSFISSVCCHGRDQRQSMHQTVVQ